VLCPNQTNSTHSHHWSHCHTVSPLAFLELSLDSTFELRLNLFLRNSVQIKSVSSFIHLPRSEIFEFHCLFQRLLLSRFHYCVTLWARPSRHPRCIRRGSRLPTPEGMWRNLWKPHLKLLCGWILKAEALLSLLLHHTHTASSRARSSLSLSLLWDFLVVCRSLVQSVALSFLLSPQFFAVSALPLSKARARSLSLSLSLFHLAPLSLFEFTDQNSEQKMHRCLSEDCSTCNACAQTSSCCVTLSLPNSCFRPFHRYISGAYSLLANWSF
jgi:hypothetical protein